MRGARVHGKIKPPATGDDSDAGAPRTAATILMTLKTVMLQWNITLSKSGARFMSLDIKDFYLGSKLPTA